MRKLTIGLGIVALVGALTWWMIGSDWRRLLTNLPTDAEVLFWTEGQRDAGFRMMDRVTMLVASREIPSSGTVRPLEDGTELQLPIDVDAYMEAQRRLKGKHSPGLLTGSLNKLMLGQADLVSA